MFSQHLTQFHGLRVFDLPAAGSADPLPEPDAVAWRLAYDWNAEEDLEAIWARFLDTVDTTRVTAVIIGAWSDEMYESDLGAELNRVIEAADRLPALTGFFLADVVSEENEISWIEQTDLAPLLNAFPRLRELGARGGHREFGPVRHQELRTLRLESGGMSGAVVRSIAESELPALERLELMLGSENYGGDTTVEDLAPLLSGTRFPALRHLGLMDSEVQDAIAEAVAQAPVVPMLETLSLALGVLTDAGAEALLSGQPLTHLARLDLHHHYLSDAMTQRVREALEPAGVEVDLDDRMKPDEYDGQVYHYIAVAE
ncbi:STM4015 family protein [Streptomyces sp. SL13]|uniref:STM4015 family protein n=1 Tax=Streptantibioticus silvisoli TaxID=2705255 RepID=A0AA90GY88_9ACTN|nr:STM4015 family protein [Streptantibioticus silvisoli]MDI5965499.1 STM4015 family protein [Streptantibioticus silvisoli]MDI5969984.1 STM4015 family protein [Streptantibioticus silvisoli]